MRVSETGASLALQPEGAGERTALVRLRAIYRRATAYQLPHPRWDDPSGYIDLNVDGREALVIPDGLGGSDEDHDAEASIGMQTETEPNQTVDLFLPFGAFERDTAEGSA